MIAPPPTPPNPRFSTSPALLVAAVLTWSLVAAPAAAQYTPSTGGGDRQIDIPTRESLEQRYDEARWQLGLLRLQPWIGLRDASWVTNQTRGDVLPGDAAPAEDDFTVSAGAGLRAYWRTGPKVTWAVHALPEYTWWQDNEAKRGWNGRYGLGVFGHFNRLSLELSRRRQEQQTFFSSEVQELTTLTTDLGRLQAEVEITDRFFVYAKGQQSEIRGDEEDAALFTRLDRDEELYGGGVRWLVARGWSVLLGWEETTTEFQGEARDLSNEGEAVVAELFYEGNRVQALASYSRRDQTATGGSEFGEFEGSTGSGQVALEVGARTTLVAFALRDLGYSVTEGASFFLRQRQGLGIRRQGETSSLGLYASIGDDSFEATDALLADRQDDVQELSAALGLQLRDLLILSLKVTYTEYDSNVADFDRDVTTFGLSIELGQVAERLRLGQSESIW